MSKWRIWRDDYWGKSWNNRQEISSPPFEGIEIPDGKILKELLSHFFIPDVQHFVEIDSDEDYVAARVTYCLQCDNPATLCECDDTEDTYTYIGYHAERVK